MKIIAMAGLARTGKDTAGNYLIQSQKYAHLSFAQPMKIMICALLNCDIWWLEKNKDEYITSIGYSPRKLMQTLGTEWGRNTLHQNFWVDIAKEKLKQFEEHNLPGVVITDCRFDNEAEMIRNMGGIICHIKRVTNNKVPAHESEEGVTYHASDIILFNNDTFDKLYEHIDSALQIYNKLVKQRKKHG